MFELEAENANSYQNPSLFRFYQASILLIFVQRFKIMRPFLFKTLALALAMILLYGCVSSIEKRRYRKGYHFSHKSNVKTKEKETELVRQEEKVSTEFIPEKEMTLANDHASIALNKEHLRSERTKREISLKEELVVPSKKESAKTISVPQSKKHISEKGIASQKEEKASGLWYFLSLLIVPFVGKFKGANNVTRWAQKNKIPSRLFITGLNVVGIGAGYGMGYLADLEIENWMSAIPFVFGLWGYGLSINNAPAHQKVQKKRQGLALFSIAALFGSFALGCSAVPDMGDGESIVHPALAAFLFVLLLAIYVFSIIFVFALSCSVACESTAAAGAAIMFGGTFILTFLFAVTVMNLFRTEDERGKSFAEKAAIIALIAAACSVPVFLILFLG